MIGVIVALIAIALVGWALLTGMPFGHRSDTLTRATTSQPDVIAEQQGNSTTVSQIGEPDVTDTTAQISMTQTTTTMLEPPMTSPSPTRSTPPVYTQPVPSNPPVARSVPPAAAPAPSGRPVSEDEAANILRGYVTANKYYQTSSECVGIVPMDHENAGYTIDVVDRCGDRGRLGRWRVDEVTREVFVRRADGRYLRP